MLTHTPACACAVRAHPTHGGQNQVHVRAVQVVCTSGHRGTAATPGLSLAQKARKVMQRGNKGLGSSLSKSSREGRPCDLAEVLLRARALPALRVPLGNTEDARRLGTAMSLHIATVSLSW